MPYYGGGSGGAGDGVTDHQLLSGRSAGNQHPATAVSVSPMELLGAEPTTVQSALAALAEKSGATVITAIAGVAIDDRSVVAFRSDDQVEPADHDNAAHQSRLAGIALESAPAIQCASR